MENPMFQLVLGVIPFLIAIFLFGLYLYLKSISRKTISEITDIRASIRKFQKDNLHLIRLSTTFSPSDPEPIGELSEKFNAQLVDLERIIAETYQKYGDLHQKANDLKLVPFWKFWILPFRWKEINREVSALWQDLDILQGIYQESVSASEKIVNLGDELSTQSREVMEKLQEAMHIYHELSSRLTGEMFLLCGRNLKEWKKTLQTQLPITYLSPGDIPLPERNQKDSITLVHRVLKSAKPEVGSLYEKLMNWQMDLAFITTSVEGLNAKHKELVELFVDLQGRKVSPFQWNTSQAEIESLGQQLEIINAENGVISVDELRSITHRVKRLLSGQAELESRCQGIQVNYLDLLQLWSSFEIQQGYDWVRNAGQVLEQVKSFDKTNWVSILDLDEFRTKFQELKRLQFAILPRDPTKKIQEDELDALVMGSRSLYGLHAELRPQLDKIITRMKELQHLQGEMSERVTTAKSVLSKTIPVIASNPFLKKISSNTPKKMQDSLEQLSSDLDLAQSGLIEAKARKIRDWFDKAEIVFDKWLMTLIEENSVRLKGLEEKFQILGNFNSLEDLAITEVREILKKAEQGDSVPLSRPGDERLLVIGRNLWAKNELWQKIVSAGRALEDIAGPVVERFQKAEKNRQLAIKWMGRGSEVIPEELGWPPTTQNLNNERKQFQALDSSWSSLKWERIQAIQLVGRLSDISEQYHGLAIQLQQVVEKAEQEQRKILEYERKLDEAKKMWLEVVAKFPEYRNLKSDVENLFAEVDRDYVGLKKRCTLGGLPYQHVLQNLRAFIRKLNDAMMPTAGNQVIDINGVLQKRMY
jgi:hypothetical protein